MVVMRARCEECGEDMEETSEGLGSVFDTTEVRTFECPLCRKKILVEVELERMDEYWSEPE